MWIFLWLVLSMFVIGIFGWSTVILYQQKSAWELFAKKNKLAFDRGKIFGPPRITGRLHNFNIDIFTDAQRTDDVRGQRYVTVIEIDLGQKLPTGGVVSTKDFALFVDNLNVKQKYNPDSDVWDPSHLIRTHDKEIMAAYLTDDRLKALNALFSMKSSMAVYMFDEPGCFLHIETTDPLRDDAHLEKILKQLAKIAKKLVLNDGETLSSSKGTTAKQSNDTAPEEEITLELEEDDDEDGGKGNDQETKA